MADGERLRIVCIVQQRMGSTRLPGKALLPLAGKSLTQNLLERVKRATKLDEVVLAVPGTPENECLWQVAHDADCQFYWYRGDENDLVGRYLACAESFGADIICRIPGDNPCVQPEYIDLAVQSYQDSAQIYVSTMYPCIDGRRYFDGVGAEVVSVSRLRWLDHATEGCPLYREHPHKLFEDRHLIDGVEQYTRHAAVSETVHLDVNSQADYDFIKDIYDHFQCNTFHVSEVLTYLDQRKGVTA